MRRFFLGSFCTVAMLTMAFSCGQSAGNEQAKKGDTTTAAANAEPITGCTFDTSTKSDVEIVNDAFVKNCMDHDFTKETFERAFEGAKKNSVTQQNPDAPSQTATIVSYRQDCDSLAIVTGDNNIVPLFLSLQSQRLQLDNKTVAIGMTKQSFAEKFGIKKDFSVAGITDTEKHDVFIFTFKNNKLSRITYQDFYIE